MHWLLLALLCLTGCDEPQKKSTEPTKRYVNDIVGHTSPCYAIRHDGDVVYCRSDWPNEVLVFNRTTKGVDFIEFKKEQPHD